MIVKSVRAIFRYEKISSPRSSVFRCCLAFKAEEFAQNPPTP
jgi:hypothetical protein